MIYNGEVRGFLGYYALADNLTREASKVFKLTNSSFFRTLAAKRHSPLMKVAKSLKRGPGRYVITLKGEGRKPTRDYELVSSTRYLEKGVVNYHHPDRKPARMMYQTRTELGRRLLAQKCEWCGSQQGGMEVHHVRKLGNLKGKTAWERLMIQRRRKTMILCVECHHELHAGRLKESKRMLRAKPASRIR